MIPFWSTWIFRSLISSDHEYRVEIGNQIADKARLLLLRYLILLVSPESVRKR